MVLRIILGALYVAMAAGQLASWPSMPRILGAYDAVPAVVAPWLAAGIIAAELLTGAWFLLRPRSPALTPVWAYTAVALVWTALGVQALARGLTVDNCGCFGLYLTQRLSWFTLAQDGLLLGYAAVLVRSGLRDAHTRASAVAAERT
jgi:Methylamine utilisation protein MauE